MSVQPYQPADPADLERALKIAVQHVAGDRAEIIEGVIQPVSPTWGDEGAAESIRDQIHARVRELGCRTGSGNIGLPGTPNWYVPDLAVVPREVMAKDAPSILPDQSLLIVEVTSPSDGDTDRVTKRRRYAQFGAPLYLLVDRQDETWTLYSAPGALGYEHAEGPHPFGTPLRLPEPFELVLDTGEF
ncbi:Uma2 family endonuclease [Streptomyces sp. ET3-23]|uniref:Uma2 family endonuclease n=1 Tax=Streptomyces sp. ET3-23 TaxID=2885643 RepID=UPI001D101179|nr:Uma2 family endonuclease [Streptomyces sp. ET3-23]MCC2278763.1 Uma2 family endonuclease [Streptomyces sp. ET3-23]